MRLAAFCSLLLCVLAAPPAFAQSPNGITEKENQRLHQALQPFAVPPDLPHVELYSDAPVANTVADRDGDGLTNEVEKRLGTNPRNPDTDGDGLLDGWEVYGVNGIDLPGKGASPLHKDIFVEMDYMRRASAANRLGPNDAVISAIEAIFANAPVPNPDGRDGIALHLELGNEVPYDEVLDPTIEEFAKLKAANFDSKRAPVYHYMIWANRYEDDDSSGYSFEVPGSDFIVTLGGWNDKNGGTDGEKIGTFAHELGHNLGLLHGGSDPVNFKPNHLSIMNYFFQTDGVLRDGKRVYDYQRFALPALTEFQLREGRGLGGSPKLRGYTTAYWLTHDKAQPVPGAGAIDWDQNGRIDTKPRRHDVNDDGEFGTLKGTPNEWSILVFDGGTIGKRQPIGTLLNVARSRYKPKPEPELSPDTQRKIRQSLTQP
jgi:Bacterial TSP3 repeat